MYSGDRSTHILFVTGFLLFTVVAATVIMNYRKNSRQQIGLSMLQMLCILPTYICSMCNGDRSLRRRVVGRNN